MKIHGGKFTSISVGILWRGNLLLFFNVVAVQRIQILKGMIFPCFFVLQTNKLINKSDSVVSISNSTVIAVNVNMEVS